MRAMLSRDEQGAREAENNLPGEAKAGEVRRVRLRVKLSEQKEKIFKFNHVFDGHVEQHVLYSEADVEKLVHRVVEGYHSTMFAYGETGSGKTYTIEGFESE